MQSLQEVAYKDEVLQQDGLGARTTPVKRIFIFSETIEAVASWVGTTIFFFCLLLLNLLNSPSSLLLFPDVNQINVFESIHENQRSILSSQYVPFLIEKKTGNNAA